MTRAARWRVIRSSNRGDLYRAVSKNVSARLLAIVGLTLATIVVARTGGATAVGSYALLRVLPGLLGVLAVAGLPSALPFFLATSRRKRRALWPTIAVILAVGATLGSVVWWSATPLLAATFFPDDSRELIALAGLTVASQLFLTVGKTSLQGLEDRRGGDIVIAAEELAFLPCFAAGMAIGLHGTAAIVFGLAAADLVVGVDAWRRVSLALSWRALGASRGDRGWIGRPDLTLARSVCCYGLRGQLGGVLLLLNMRLDFVILGAMAGPAVLGGYAVASKYAELLKLPGTALTWVSYPKLANSSATEAATRARALVKPAIVLVALAAVPLFLLAEQVLGLLYGEEFVSAATPARVLVSGLLLAGASGVASGYLYGRGHPGLNSLVMGVGLVLTGILDLALIPRYDATGAAVASMVSYLVTDLLLIVLLYRLSKPDPMIARTPVAEVGVAL